MSDDFSIGYAARKSNKHGQPPDRQRAGNAILTSFISHRGERISAPENVSGLRAPKLLTFAADRFRKIHLRIAPMKFSPRSMK